MRQNLENEVTKKIQLIANRVRCPVCHSGADESAYMVVDEIRFRKSFFRPKMNPPMFKRAGKLRINKTQTLDGCDVLAKICLRCGASRQIVIPNISV